jgi:hypothetical protein
MDDLTIRCRDECGASQPDVLEAVQAGWTNLQIAGGWRCGACCRALAAVAGIPGAGTATGDLLPPTSIGALKRETASTISPPTVKA